MKRGPFLPIILICMAAGLLCPLSTTAAGDTSRIQAVVVVKTSDHEKASRAVVAAAQAMKGYFTERTLDAVTLNVPANRAGDLMDVAARQGEEVDRRITRKDLGEQLLRKRASLKAKQDVFRQYKALLANADIEAALYVERELVQLVAEIETLKGEVRFLEHRARYAQVQVHFKFLDVSAPLSDGRSSFPWLNTMNMVDLLKEF